MAALEHGYTKMMLKHDRYWYGDTEEWGQSFKDGLITVYRGGKSSVLNAVDNFWFFCKPNAPEENADVGPLSVREGGSYYIQDFYAKDCKFRQYSFDITKYQNEDGLEYQFKATAKWPRVLRPAMAGSIACGYGRNSGNMNKPMIYDTYTKCGLGAILIRLCFIDDDMNALGNILPEVEIKNTATPHTAFGVLAYYRRFPDRVEWIKCHCKNLWVRKFLETDDSSNQADYLHAALLAGFTKMMIIEEPPSNSREIARIHPGLKPAEDTRFYEMILGGMQHGFSASQSTSIITNIWIDQN